MGTKPSLAVKVFFSNTTNVSGVLLVLASILFSLIVPAVSVAATFPNTLGYQGYIEQSGTPVTGTENFTFSLYSATSGGSALWTETQSNVPVTGGYFSVSLGTQTPFPSTLDFSQSYYLQVTINGTTLAPRQSLDAVPYAHVAYGVVQSTTAPQAPSNGSTYFDPTGTGTFYVYDVNSGWTALATTTNSGASTTPTIVNLATGVTGTLPAANGGTGLTGSVGLGILVGNGSGGWTQVATSSLGLTTTNVAEGTNLYFTNARADNRFAGDLAATTTTALAEGSNLYFTNARADARIALATSLPALQTLPSLTLTGTINANNNVITGVPTPVNATDAANKSYVDTFVQGLTWQAPVIALGSTTPPVSPNTGDRYVVGNSATGAWIGEDRTIATWTGSAWSFATPSHGYTLFVTNTSSQYNYNGTSWVPIGSGTNFSALTGIAAVNQGGTGIATGPSYGQLLLGNSSGGYSLVATSSLGFVTPSGVGTILAGTTTDAIAQGTTNLYYSNSLARNALTSTALGLSYSTTTGQIALASGYTIPSIASTTAWNNGLSQFTTSGANTYLASGNLGVDNSNPQYPLDVTGAVNAGSYFQNGQILAYAGSSGNLSIGLGANGAVATSTFFNLNNTAIGNGTLAGLSNSGNSNTAVGYKAINSGAGISYDTAVGFEALYNGGSNFGDNDAFGYQSQYTSTGGYQNASFGAQSLKFNTSGYDNAAFGFDALVNNTYPFNSVAVGASAGQGTASYSNNGGVYVGFEAGEFAQNNSNFNTLIGYAAGSAVTTGSNNIVIGAATSSTGNITTGSQNILIGASTALPSSTGNGQLDIGNFIYGTGLTGTGSTVSSGSIGIGTTTPGATLAVNGNALVAGALAATGGLNVTGTTTTSALSTGALAINGALTDTSTATSTFAGGHNITSGCYAVNGVCLTSGSGGLSANGVASILAATTTDAIAQGSTNLYYSNSLARNALSSNALGLTYASTTGQFALTSGYTIPTTASTTAWNNGISQWTTSGSNINYSGGSVGIGTTTPGATLAVNGSGYFTGTVAATGLQVSSTGANPTLTNPVGSAGVIIRGSDSTTYGQLRIVANGGGWADGQETTYFQASNGLNNNLVFQGGSYGSDAPLSRLLFSASSTQFTDGQYTSAAVPSALFAVVGSSAAKKGLVVQGAPAQTADLFETQNSSGSVLDTITSGGNLGIGTTSPSYGLVVSNTGVNTGFGVAQEELVGSGSETGLYFLNTGTGGRGYNLISTGGSSGIGQGNFAIVDSTAGAARFTINSIGNIGIGATPSATAGNRLVINGGSNNSHLQFLSGNASDFAEFDIGRASNDASIDVADGAGNFSTDAVAGDLVIRDDTNGHILFNNNSGGGASTMDITNGHVSVNTASNDGSYLEVYGSNDTADTLHVRNGNTYIYEGGASSNPYAVIGAYNSSSNGSIPLELQSQGGYVGIGTNGQYDNDRLVVNGVGTNGMGINIAAGATGIEIFNNSGTGSYNGVTFFKNGSNSVGGISVSQTAIVYGTGSDARIKQNIATTSDSLAQLMGVQVADFEFKSDPSEQVTGFIAQNLENIFPEAVTTNGDNGLVPLGASSTPWTVDYGRVTPLIVKAVQDIANISSTFETNLVAWLGNAQNGIHDIYTNTSHQKTLCVGDAANGGETCITKTQLDQLLQRTDMAPASSGSTASTAASSATAPSNSTGSSSSTSSSSTSTPNTSTQSSGSSVDTSSSTTPSSPSASDDSSTSSDSSNTTSTTDSSGSTDSSTSATPSVPSTSGTDTGTQTPDTTSSPAPTTDPSSTSDAGENPPLSE